MAASNLTYLAGHAEDVRIVLHKPPHPRKTSQTSAGLVPVKDTKLGQSNGKLLERSGARIKDKTVTGTVHRLQGKLVFVDVEEEHVLLVVVVVTRSLPEIDIEHVGRDD